MDQRRRTFVANACLSLAYLSSARFILAQSRAQALVPAINKNIASAQALLKTVRSTGADLNAGRAAQFLGDEANLRRQLADTMRQVPPEGVGEYILPEHRALVDEMGKQGIKVLPTRDQIDLTKVTPGQSVPNCKETVTTVAVDIVLTALGLTEDVRTALLLAVDKVPELKNALDAFAKSVSLRDREQAVDAMLRLVQTLQNVAILQKIAATLEKQVASRLTQQLLTKFGARFVPIAGQVFLAISFAVTIYMSWDRLVTAVTCAATTMNRHLIHV